MQPNHHPRRNHHERDHWVAHEGQLCHHLTGLQTSQRRKTHVNIVQNIHQSQYASQCKGTYGSACCTQIRTQRGIDGESQRSGGGNPEWTYAKIPPEHASRSKQAYSVTCTQDRQPVKLWLRLSLQKWLYFSLQTRWPLCIWPYAGSE